ncbi:MAG TPA: serine/threonine-protein kinase [Kofleriaceae bacterium]|nr:serine/threonine-protein kinase [Kofleriaceae bacterium]
MPVSPGPIADPLIGVLLDGRYGIEARIGKGGMGAVYRATHAMLGERVAVKVLHPDLAADPDAARRFVREARGTFRIDHPNCIRVSDFGLDPAQRVLYLVMEYLDGRTVGDEIGVDGPIASQRVIHIMRQVSAALDAAHAAGMVHRDLKPDNLMLFRRGDDPDFVKVLDFGLAKLFEPDSAGTTMFQLAKVTQEGTVFGTPEYMSPEQATGQALDPRSDIYAAGVCMYEMLTGVMPFRGGNVLATLSKQVREQATPPAQRRPELGIPPALDALVMACMAKRAADRPQSARELGAHLDTMAIAGPRPSRLPRQVAASPTVDLTDQADQLPAPPRLPAVPPPARTESADPGPETLAAAGLAPRRGRLRWLLLALLLLGAGGVGLALIRSGGDGDDGGGGVSAAAGPVDAGARPAPPSRPVDAGAPTAGGDAGPARPPPNPRDRDRELAREKARTYLEAAARARRAGQTLKEIAALDSALAAEPGNREAAYRLGDALLRSGDKPRACKYLRRASSLAAARARAREAGCSD